MPTYSYRCTDCEHAFDIQQAFTDDSLTVCPECSGGLRKIFGSVGVTFNGSGFYRTDSRSDKKPGGTKEPGKGTSGSGDSGSSGGAASGPTNGSTDAGSKPAKESASTPSKPSSGPQAA